MSDLVKVVRHLFEMLELAGDADVQEWLDEAMCAEGISDETKRELEIAANQ